MYAVASGIFHPEILVDPIIYGVPGEDALVFHEACHVAYRHALQRVLWLVTSSVAFAAMLVWLDTPLAFAGMAFFSMTAPCYFIAARRHELEADVYAFDAAGAQQFTAFVYMHPHPKSRWGRWLYGNSAAERIQRTRDEALKGRES